MKEKKAVLASAGLGQLQIGLAIAEKQPYVVYGTLDGEILARLRNLAGIPIYLYETG